MEWKNEHFRYILHFYFHKDNNAADAHNEICDVYSVDCLTEWSARINLKNVLPEIFH